MMNRREFSRAAARAVAAAAVFPATTRLLNDRAGPRLSVMLWTVFRELPFEQRLEKVAEAGYRAVELVEEFKNWQAADFARVAARRRALDIRFDATAGLSAGVADPAARQKFLEEVGKMLPIMESWSARNLSCYRAIRSRA